jgi:hypothetical protein
MTIIPKRNSSWKSILKFYYYFTQTVDQQSQLRLFREVEDAKAA